MSGRKCLRAAFRKSGEVRTNGGPSNLRVHPDLMRRVDNSRLINAARLDVQDIWMDRRSSIQWGPALRAEVPSQRVTTFASLRESSRASFQDSEVPSFDTNTDVEGAPRASSAIFTMAVICRANIAFALIANIPAQTPSRDRFNHLTLHVRMVPARRSQLPGCFSPQS